MAPLVLSERFEWPPDVDVGSRSIARTRALPRWAICGFRVGVPVVAVTRRGAGQPFFGSGSTLNFFSSALPETIILIKLCKINVTYLQWCRA
jgi:hypothetical protein